MQSKFFVWFKWFIIGILLGYTIGLLWVMSSPTAMARSPRPQPTPPPPSTGQIQWGVFNGLPYSGLATLEAQVGRQVNVQGVFIGDGDSFAADFGGYYGLGPAKKTLLVYWESSLTAKQIADGQADTFLRGWASDIKAYGYPVILSVLDEMNGDWIKYTGDPDNYKLAWIRVHDIFTNVSNVKLAYVVNNNSYPNISSNSLTSYYPGDQYVDIVGVDGFNGYRAWGGPSLTWSQVFVTNQNAAIPTLKAAFPNKPLWIMSTASCQGTTKAQWIKDMGVGVKQYGVAGWVWFNVNKECNWKVDSDSNSLSAFKSIIGQ